MANLSQVIVSLGDVSLSVEDWLARLRRRGQLQPLLREAVVEQFLLSQATQAGLTVSREELQQAADAFRRRLGLTSAEQFRAWLAGNRQSLLDFEDALERDLLLEKLQDDLTRDRIAPHFAANQANYARAGLRLLQVAREDLAREMVLQLREEGHDFAELARAHSQHPTRAEGGRLGVLGRGQLPPVVADAVFAARAGEVVGPLATPQGFQVLLVETLTIPELDAALSARIRQELFEVWLRQQLSSRPLQLPLLEGEKGAD